MTIIQNFTYLGKASGHLAAISLDRLQLQYSNNAYNLNEFPQ